MGVGNDRKENVWKSLSFPLPPQRNFFQGDELHTPTYPLQKSELSWGCVEDTDYTKNLSFIYQEKRILYPEELCEDRFEFNNKDSSITLVERLIYTLFVRLSDKNSIKNVNISVDFQGRERIFLFKKTLNPQCLQIWFQSCYTIWRIRPCFLILWVFYKIQASTYFAMLFKRFNEERFSSVENDKIYPKTGVILLQIFLYQNFQFYSPPSLPPPPVSLT